MEVITGLKQLTYRWKKYAFERESLLFYSLELNNLTSELKLENELEIRFARKGEGEEKLYQLIPQGVVHTRLQEGQRCCMILRSNKLVSYCWITQEKTYVGEIKREIKLKNGDIYFYDCYTLPEERGKGIYPSLLIKASHNAFHEGFRRAIIFSEAGNFFSRRGISKAGFQLIGEIPFSRILGSVRLRKSKFSHPINFIEILNKK